MTLRIIYLEQHVKNLTYENEQENKVIHDLKKNITKKIVRRML